jgi:hypothetical protein
MERPDWPKKELAMSSEMPSFDPYQPPPAIPSVSARTPLPTGLKAICIIAVVLGAIGTFLSCIGFAGLAINESVAGGMGFPMGDGGGQAQEVQKEMQAGILAISQQYLPFTIAIVCLHLVAGILLATGGALGLKSVPAGRLTLVIGFLAAIVYEIAQTTLNVIIQTKTIPLVRQSMEQMLQQPGQPGVPQGMGQLMVVFMFVILGITLVTVLVKIAFYTYSLYYLHRQDIVARFSA